MGLSLFRGLVVAALLLAAALPVRPAAAQMESREAITLQNQILQLRHELQALEAQRAGGGQPYYAQPAYPPTAGSEAGSTAQLVARVGALEEQVRQLRGRVDELENTLQHTAADLGKQIDDLKFQLQTPHGTASAGPPPATPGKTAGTAASRAVPPPPAPPPAAEATQATGPRTPELALHEGYAALARGDYVVAERDAHEVLTKRTSPRAYDAQYLLAQSLAGQRQWSRAAIAYDDTYNRAPKGGHAQEALLGLANALTAVSEKRAACETLTKLHAEFPHPRAALHDQIAAASQRAGCKA